MRRFAQVRIPGTGFILHVDVSESLQELGQRKRKRLRRQGVAPLETEATILAAVAAWWSQTT